MKYILSKKKALVYLTGGLVSAALISHWIFKNHEITNILFIIGGILGALPIMIQAYQALRIKIVTIDLLVSIAVIGAFLIKNYEEAAIVTFLFLLGSHLEKLTIKKTRSAIKELVAMAPERALKLIDGEYVNVDIFDVEIDDILKVLSGQKVPVDGKVIDGMGHANEASITGEAFPRSINKNDNVFAGTILEDGTITIQAEKVGEDTTFGKIIKLVEEASDSKSQAEKFIDKFARYYTPLVLLIAFLVYLITKNVELAITVLVLGCPGALVIGVPVSNVAGIGRAAQSGILIKGSEVINKFSNVDIIAFDKTGTLTRGNPSVEKIINYDNKKAINYLYSIENDSTHPLAKAIVNYFKPIEQYDVNNLETIRGKGIKANIEGDEILVGNIDLMNTYNIEMNSTTKKDIQDILNEELSIVISSINNRIELILGIGDQIKSDTKDALKKLKSSNIQELYLLSGDNQKVVDTISNKLNIDMAIGEMLPDEKSNFIKSKMKEGKIVAFVGDGINDSPSLASADIGIAMGSGTDTAIETSDIVLINSSIGKVNEAYRISRKTANNMKQNIAIALGTVLLLLFALFFSKWMNMSIGMLVHEASILLVIINALRLLKKEKEIK